MKLYELVISTTAQDDLERLNDFLLSIDVGTAERAAAAIEKAYDVLIRFPHTCRKAHDGDLGPARRELLVNFGSSGYVALFEISAGHTVTVLAVRHQRESDYH